MPAAIVALCNTIALFSGAPQYVAYLFYMEAVALVKRELGLEPYDRMEDAVKAAVEAAR